MAPENPREYVANVLVAKSKWEEVEGLLNHKDEKVREETAWGLWDVSCQKGDIKPIAPVLQGIAGDKKKWGPVEKDQCGDYYIVGRPVAMALVVHHANKGEWGEVGKFLKYPDHGVRSGAVTAFVRLAKEKGLTPAQVAALSDVIKDEPGYADPDSHPVVFAITALIEAAKKGTDIGPAEEALLPWLDRKYEMHAQRGQAAKALTLIYLKKGEWEGIEKLLKEPMLEMPVVRILMERNLEGVPEDKKKEIRDLAASMRL